MKRIVLILIVSALSQAFPRAEEETLKDRIWLWCHVEGAHNIGTRIRHNYGFGDYRYTVSPRDAADFLGIENVFMIKYNIGPNPGPKPDDFRHYFESRNFDSFKQVIWSLVSEGGKSSAKERARALELAEAKTNVTGFVMDDFFSRKRRALSPSQLAQLREQLAVKLPNQSRPRIWVVLYGDEILKPKFNERFLPWLREVDGITVWFKDQASLTFENMEMVLSTLEKRFTGCATRPKLMLGCYAWRYLEKTHGNLASFYMANQLEFARRNLAADRIQGVIFLASCIADATGPAAPGINAVKNWIALNRDTKIEPAAQAEPPKSRE